MIKWDEAKRLANLAKHGLDFADFSGFDAPPNDMVDTRFEYGEVRYRSIGRINRKWHLIAYTLDGEDLRLITFHRVHERNLRKYGI